MPMRRLCITLLCGLVAVPAAVAATRATGDGVLELNGVNGVVAVNATRGALWGQVDSGKVVLTDPIAGDGDLLVSGCEKKVPGVTEHTTICTGTNIHFRSTCGKYRLWFNGSGIDFTAVGVGRATLTGNILADDTGDYALDGGKWNSVGWKPFSITFGVQPPAASPTSP
jgi:hypothetical protein